MPPISINLSKVSYPKPKRMVEVGNSLGDYTLKDARTVLSNIPIGSFDAYSCSMVCIHNGCHKYLAHLAPELHVPALLEKKLDKVIDNFTRESDNVQAIIVGGWNSQDFQSFHLPMFIADTLDKLKIDFSMFCGKPNGAQPENLVALHKNVNIWSDKFKELFEGIDVKKATKDDISKALNKHYEVVELSDNIPINITEGFRSTTQ